MRSTAFLLSSALAALLLAGCGAAGNGTERTGSPAEPAAPSTPDTGSTAMGDTITFTGTIRRSELEGGFYAIASDDGRTFDPRNLPEEFKTDGLRVRVKARVRNDMGGIHQVGPIVDIVEIAKE
jgi:hypothetical protein